MLTTLILALFACATEGDATAGAAVYDDNCASCHGADGEGGTGPAMADVVPGAAEADLEGVILDGEGEMPAQSLDATQTADVIAYIVETWG